MHKKFPLFTAILLALVLLFILGCVQREMVEAYEKNPPTIEKNLLEREEVGDEFWMKQAKYNNNTALCDFVSEENRTTCYSFFENESLEACLKSGHEECIVAFAKEYEEPSLCIFLRDEKKVEKCVSEVLKERGRKDIHEGKCESDECRLRVAHLYRLPQACDGMENISYKGACETLIFKEDRCKSLPPFVRDGCYLLLATRLNYTDLCGKIRYPAYLTRCLTDVAIKLKKPDPCMALQYNENLYSCLENYAVKSCDEEGCRRISRLAPSYTSCLYNLATKCGKPHVCNDIKDDELKGKCYTFSIYLNNITDINSCLKITHNVWRDKCLLQAALLNKSACDFIEIEKYREKCKGKN